MPPPYCYDYPRPAVTVDLAVFAIDGETLKVLMIRRKHDPFAGKWALPGGFLEIEEDFETGARRELKEETGLEVANPIHFVGVYGDPGRDPRGRTISIAYWAFVVGSPPPVAGGDDAAEAGWLDAIKTVKNSALAFDHGKILLDAIESRREAI
jgi:8-oxo-dGTP diphosphatase